MELNINNKYEFINVQSVNEEYDFSQVSCLPTVLKRSCTRYDCRCVENGMKPCSVYNICTKCHKRIEGQCWDGENICKCYIHKEIKLRHAEKEKLSQLFENIFNNTQWNSLNRQYSSMYISRQNYQRVMNYRGTFSYVIVSGSGNVEWFFYHSIDGDLLFLIKKLDGSWNWQFGQPSDEDIY